MLWRRRIPNVWWLPRLSCSQMYASEAPLKVRRRADPTLTCRGYKALNVRGRKLREHGGHSLLDSRRTNQLVFAPTLAVPSVFSSR